MQITPNRAATAIKRYECSRPILRAIEDGLLSPEVTLFDYGCGRGDDVRLLRERGISCSGWDPVHASHESQNEADIVNLGYVLNVIESPSEREDTLRAAFSLARKVLIISVLTDLDSNRAGKAFPHADGIISSRGTFQKFFTQQEIRLYVQNVLGKEPVSAGLGMLYVFKDDSEFQLFVASRVRRRANRQQRIAKVNYSFDSADVSDLLFSYKACVEELGRIPLDNEFERNSELNSQFGSSSRAFRLLQKIVPEWNLNARIEERRNDLLVYLALSRFQKRPNLNVLPQILRNDIRAFFRSYKAACTMADELLFKAGRSELIDQACLRSPLGKLLPKALYLYRDYLERLEPILRIYVGCAQALVGEVDGANIIKIHRLSGKVSYLVYGDFDQDEHPSLQRSVTVFLRTQTIRDTNYSESDNPPILHRKETFVGVDYPNYEMFKNLTTAEEAAGLLEEPTSIGFRKSWAERLQTNQIVLRGHKVIRPPFDQTP